ncbi:hypothetical protein [Rhizobium brockwellii]|uniref:hypothetical protein n=1 Tax=Rhizobium brockwellii TaxID=3019932 RepID=UPI001FEF3A6F|nr:hypothetical protein [Rhizobium brockwellii]
MFNRDSFFLAVSVVVGIVVVGFAGVWIGGGFTFDANGTANLLQRLQQMALLTIVIERVVEVYLGVSQQNGPDRHDPGEDQSVPDAKRPASVAALVLGILIAIAGVRILDTLGTVSFSGSGQWLATAIWKGVDIVLSGGLLAGGSFLIHEVMELISGSIKRVDPSSQRSATKPANVETTRMTSEALADFIAAAQVLPASAKGQAMIDRCEAAFEANKNDCSAFVRAVASASGVTLTGQADDIVDQISGSGWVALTGGAQAAAMADAGMLVIAGLKAADHTPPRNNGHVAIVVSGALAHGKYPTGYWGSSGGSSAKNQTLNYSWNSSDRDNVHYAARSL